MVNQNKRPVVTGLGLVSAIGNNVSESFGNAISGICGIKSTNTFNTENCYSDLAAEVKDIPFINISDSDSMDKVSLLCIKATSEAMQDASITDFGGSRMASVIMGSCVGGVNSAEKYYRNNKDASFVNKISITPIANHIARTFNAGGVVTNIANACAAGTISIAYACDLIRAGKADVVIAGGADAFASIPYAGFLSLHALSEKPCSPFNHCDGITLGEGAGALVIESYEHAQKRNAKIYCDVLGSGVSSDAYHITAPRPDGKGQIFAIRRAMENSDISPSDIGYINAHGTGTAKNDEAEFLSLHTIFDGENNALSVSSTKSMVGHCLGAAGAMEAVFTIKALCEGVIPPTIGYSDEDLAVLKEKAGEIDFTPNFAKKKELKTVMSNSFAFGGNNASIVFSKVQSDVKIPHDKERIFITGLGIVSPLGNDIESYIEKTLNKIPFNADNCESVVGSADYEKCDLKMAFYRKLDKFSQLQAVSGKLAIKDAKLEISEDNATDIGIAVGTCDGPLSTVCGYQQDILSKGNSAGSAFKFPNTVYNAAGGYLSICSGIRGYNVTLTNGIQSGLASLAYGANIIRNNQAKTVLATGTDENSEIMTELYQKLGLVKNEENEGFNLSDGSTTLVLESESSVKSRGAKPYAELKGYGLAACPVSYDEINNSEKGLIEAVNSALSDADLSIYDIDGVCSFANGVSDVDKTEEKALFEIFGEKIKPVPIFNIHDICGEGRAATAALSAVHAALMLSGRLGDSIESKNCGDVSLNTLNNILVISYVMGGVYSAVIISKMERQ